MENSESNKFITDFYSRQMTMKEFTVAKQKKLLESKVAVVGVGGLGTISSIYLALVGVGKLILIDQDTVEIKNLHRQILYKTSDLHYPKAEIASYQLKKMNPLIKIEAYSDNINANNVEKLLDGVDCVVDGLDNMSTRYLVNSACVKMKIPYVFGAAIGLEGNLSVFSSPDTGCLKCLLPTVSDEDLMNCETRGVIGATPGIIGSMQAMETIKILTGIGSTLKGKLLVCDFSDMYFTIIDISKNSNCPVCQLPEGMNKIKSDKLVWLCGRNTANINPKISYNLDLNELAKVVQREFNLRLKSKLALIFDHNGLEVSLFKSGRMLIKNVNNEKTAFEVYRLIFEKLKISN